MRDYRRKESSAIEILPHKNRTRIYNDLFGRILEALEGQVVVEVVVGTGRLRSLPLPPFAPSPIRLGAPFAFKKQLKETI